MAKKDILDKAKTNEEYPLIPAEQAQLASLIALVKQARMAQDMLYSNIVEQIVERCEIVGAQVDINMQEVMESGDSSLAKLIVTRV